MPAEKSLDEALDEIDKWSEKMVKEIEGLTPEEAVKYFRKARTRFEKKLARKIPVRRAKRSEKV